MSELLLLDPVKKKKTQDGNPLNKVADIKNKMRRREIVQKDRKEKKKVKKTQARMPAKVGRQEAF